MKYTKDMSKVIDGLYMTCDGRDICQIGRPVSPPAHVLPTSTVVTCNTPSASKVVMHHMYPHGIEYLQDESLALKSKLYRVKDFNDCGCTICCAFLWLCNPMRYAECAE
jgi:hypothetical protein